MHEGASQLARLRLEVRGAVQGVGFRPFVYRLAADLALAGWVLNDARGVIIEVEGPPPDLERFRERLLAEKPAHALVQSQSADWLEPEGARHFEIRHSDAAGAKTALVLPDLATCPECLAEVLDPGDRRHRYPFTNCTNCGPRFSILRTLPYDRPNTTMAGFTQCPACRAEYEDPRDRRFHAQPNACPACGPALALRDGRGRTLARGDAALAGAAAALAAGRIVAVKGLGGFHLMCDARDEAVVARLRERKLRRGKPFALMVRDLDQARGLCEIDVIAAQHLGAAETPILLLPRRAGAPVAAGVAPGNPFLGVMLPATPLHHLLLGACGFPVVATSGNLTDEPICTDDDEALDRLGPIADQFLGHDRPIQRHVDDSVAWVMAGGLRLLRRARGYAPLPVPVSHELPPILAVGAHLKNTVALAVGRQVFVSQHIGDLESAEAMSAFERVIADFLDLYEVRPAAIAHDLHPDYLSTKWAREAARTQGARLVPVQHHHAHLAACLAESGIEGRALGITWDGTGFGTDGTVWGGEFLLGDAAGFERVGHLRPFLLPGGEAAVREPRRTALALLWEVMGRGRADLEVLSSGLKFDDAELSVLVRMLDRGLNCPVTTSMGRLFDGVAALLGIHPRVTFEGEAAMALEFVADPAERGAYPVGLGHGLAGGGVAPALDGGPAEAAAGAVSAGPLVLDWAPLLAAVREDLGRGLARGVIAARFHNGLVQAAVEVAGVVGEERVALSGGCFQNRLLAERLAAALGSRGHVVVMHAQVPPNDGGVSLGQVAVAAARLAAEEGD